MYSKLFDQIKKPLNSTPIIAPSETKELKSESIESKSDIEINKGVSIEEIIVAENNIPIENIDINYEEKTNENDLNKSFDSVDTDNSFEKIRFEEIDENELIEQLTTMYIKQNNKNPTEIEINQWLETLREAKQKEEEVI